jgi:hypothetical protein
LASRSASFAVRQVACVIGLLSVSGCMPQRAVVRSPPTGPGLHVLFVGNSLTYVNNLPALVETFADSAGEPLLETRTIAKPDYSLEDHWNDGDARAAIAKGGWNLVVLQQGPSSLESSRTLLLQYAEAFAQSIRAAGARPALYQVWPASDRPADFPRANESYRLAADAVNGALFPVGEAWLATQRIDPSVPLYAFDGLHPSAEGSYLAALVIYAVLYARSPVGLPATLRLRNGASYAVSGHDAAVLQAAAEAVTAPERGQRWVPNVGALQKPGAPRACAATSPPKSAELKTTRNVPVDWPRHCG